MSLVKIFDPKKSMQLYGLNKKFDFFKNLILKNSLPKVTLLTGEKGIGKSTLVNHIMHYLFDKENYDEEKKLIIKESNFFNHLKNNSFPNIIHLNGSDSNKVSIEDVRVLKNQLLKSSVLDKKRFIILDNIENFNQNSLNALLKIIEEPNEKNYFILINNNSKPLLETIKSRCLEIKIIISSKAKNEIIDLLIKRFDQKLALKKDIVHVTPGNFIKYNFIFNEKKLDINNKLSFNFNAILNLYKKEKDFIYKDLLLFLVGYNSQIDLSKNLIDKQKMIEKRLFAIKKINDFFLYNLNQSTLLNSIETNF